MYDILIGKNIILRKAKENDYKSMLKNVWGNEEVYKYMLYTPTLTIEEAIIRNEKSMEFQKNNFAYYIALKDSDIAIGLCAIREYDSGSYEERGICLGTDYQGKGYGKEVIELLLDLAFNMLNAKDFLYGYFNDNYRSKHLAELFGFKYLKTIEIERPWDKANKIVDLALLTREEYEKRKLVK